MSTSEAPASSSGDTPSINNSRNRSKAKSKCSIRSLFTRLKAKHSLSNPKPQEKTDQSASSSSATVSRSGENSGTLSLSELIQHELCLVDSTFTEAKKYIDHANVQINQAREKFIQARKKFEDLQRRGGSERDLDELRKAIAKLKIKISSQMKISSADFNPHLNRWPNVNNVPEELMHFFYQEPEFAHTSDSDGLLKTYHDLPEPLRYCLLCFFKFPTEAIVKRTIMIYLWIGQGFISWHQWSREKLLPKEEELPPEEDVGNQILDELTTKGFIEPVYQKCSFMPDSCRMTHFVRSSLSNEAKVSGFISDKGLDLDTGFVDGGLCGQTCLVNVGEAIIDGSSETFEKMKNVRSLYLGRWQNVDEAIIDGPSETSEKMKHVQSLYLERWKNSTTHHIEVVDAKILHELKKLKCLKFLSLRGISMITELPSFISMLNDMKILDFRACHNLELIPDNISLLKNLTHLDMSECYFLEYMPDGIAELSNLEVLKGFIVGDYESCTLDDLSRLPKLRKLNIYTNSEYFPSGFELEEIAGLEGLQKLTINWGGHQIGGNRHQLPPELQKLDLQGFPGTRAADWLRPGEETNHKMLKNLKKLYIRGGKLRDVDRLYDEPWSVEILRLKYLSELKIDWRQLRLLFPKLIYLHQEECPMFSNFPCDKNGVWMDEKAIDTLVQVQQQHVKKATSLSGSGPSVAQDDCNICPIDE
ncbi:hypothetical protein Vadar_019218 [Vaccinium darrowii]|uniref:Uncharacterized protein n=1 Tax=Vaccinium darrowii TaxID=229202 RepID=A0ACB7XB87_9ERIC|nr:hypothetical protein Vadar_019218 [Vaccinium darrowii]